MARNIEVLRNYFLGKDPQLKETMADNSLRLIGIPGKHFVLRTELLKRLQALQDELEDADEGLLALINTVDGRVALERSERIQHDNTIMGKVNDNVAAIMNLGNALSLERDARQSADRQINGRIDTNSTNIAYIQDWIDNTDFVLDEDLAAALENYYTKAQVNQLISAIPTFDIEVVQTLPVQDISDTTIYLVPSQDPQTANSYDEFIHVNNAWEQIGSTAIDLSNYYTKTEVDGMIPTQTSQLTNNGDGATNPFVNKYAKTNMPNGGIYLETGDQAFLISNGQKLTNRLLDARDIATMEVNTNKVTSVSSSSTDTQYPSAKCVYDILQSAGIKSIRTNQNMWEIDDGVYIVGQGVNFQLKQNSPSDFINTTTKTALLVIQNTSSSLTAFSLWDGDWLYNGTCNKTFNTYSLNYADLSTVESTTNKVTSINSSSTDTQYPSAKCVYDALQNAGGPTITYGTQDLTPGVSPLADGEFYFVYS